MPTRIPTALWVTGLVCGWLMLGYLVTTANCREAARKKISRQRVKEVDDAISTYLGREKRCPATLDELVAGNYVPSHSLEDSWGTRLTYSCSTDDWQVRSAGRDHIFDTIDDITSDPIVRENR
ncbi:MAG TPA: hypothetical protein VKQ32_04140 [Polyangia bacterium]|nr:hypothetical protein [Polyangia bacterium]